MQQLSDKKLYQLCKKYGANALLWRRKFTGLLPEVNRRRLYENKGFSSIFDFSFKLAGLSEKQVRLALNLDERFKDKPVLKMMFVNGEVSINKLTRVTSVATPANEEFWAEKIQQLSKSALETLIKDIKNENQNGFFKPQNEAKVLPGQNLGVSAGELKLDPDVEAELLGLQAKGINVNELLREFFARRRQELAQEKEDLAVEASMACSKSRYIPVKIRRHLQKEYGCVCSIDGCRRPAQEIHHTRRYGLSHGHNPKYLAPLCREHHAIAHAIDVKVQARKNSG